MGMWGSFSESDERYYRRRAAEDRAVEKRRRKIADWMPFRKETLARVKAGEITLEEGQRLIRAKERKQQRETQQKETSVA